ncbi:hypothetical protein SAMN05421810_101228 [Amycolatopsis arida]|uniref:Uncharacterized protein n=1 Tax=Amycolatopsis arida TaxID=587909 RepID=A0A1I5KN28_9PSEU|nr:hypothetical protein [Amycolatopsis arida]TDX97124.1 hypothetical protein CLV69_102226 [Amycolatopsis arida]SFO86388.1 hypothetical protein SAMN05421810_101228 [Amycolatopsis arida]
MPADRTRVTLPWLVPALVVVVSLAVGGGLLARELYRPPEQPVDAVIATPTSTPLPPDQQPGSPMVRLARGAATHPEGEPVRRLLQAYFDAINGRNYERWKTTVTVERVAVKPKREWLTEYRSTRDGNILVYRIETAPQGRLQVLVAFTSTQDVADAPPGLPATCVHWRLALPVLREGGQWKLDTVPAGTTPEREPCPQS